MPNSFKDSSELGCCERAFICCDPHQSTRNIIWDVLLWILVVSGTAVYILWLALEARKALSSPIVESKSTKETLIGAPDLLLCLAEDYNLRVQSCEIEIADTKHACQGIVTSDSDPDTLDAYSFELFGDDITDPDKHTCMLVRGNLNPSFRSVVDYMSIRFNSSDNVDDRKIVLGLVAPGTQYVRQESTGIISFGSESYVRFQKVDYVPLDGSKYTYFNFRQDFVQHDDDGTDVDISLRSMQVLELKEAYSFSWSATIGALLGFLSFVFGFRMYLIGVHLKPKPLLVNLKIIDDPKLLREKGPLNSQIYNVSTNDTAGP